VRHSAAEQLVQLGPPATSCVIAATHDANAPVRRLACSILLRTIPSSADRAAAALLAAAGDSDESVRATAVEQLGSCARDGPLRTSSQVQQRALRAIRAALEDPSPRVRDAAGWALWNLAALAKSAVSDLERALDGPDPSLRVLATMALLKISPNHRHPRIAAALTPLLVDHSDP
jgi:HEAT repeat protein